jgi:hypothetical protein
MRCLSTTTTRGCDRCTRDASTLVVWHNGWAPSCTQHAERLSMGHPDSVLVDLSRDDRPCATCGMYPIAHVYDPTRVRPEPVTGHDYEPGLPPDPDPQGRCRIWMRWCFTHGEAESFGHYLATHPGASTD